MRHSAVITSAGGSAIVGACTWLVAVVGACAGAKLSVSAGVGVTGVPGRTWLCGGLQDVVLLAASCVSTVGWLLDRLLALGGAMLFLRVIAVEGVGGALTRGFQGLVGAGEP